MTAATLLPSRTAVLTAGMRWLYETRQPAAAILSHHGTTVHADGNRHYGFIPSGWDRNVVITVSVTDVTMDNPHSPYARPTNPIRLGEMDEIAGLLAELGGEVVRTWNGHPGVSGSLALKKPAHPMLRDAVARYRAGCPRHKSVFCARPHDGSTPCPWLPSGSAQVIKPHTGETEPR